MKKLFLSLFLFSISFSIYGQLKFSNLKIAGGFGLQHYAGDLGNGFYQIKGTKYGVATFSINYSVNHSYSIKLMGTLGDLGIHKSQKGQPIESIENHNEHDHHHHHHVDESGDAHGVNAETENLNSRMALGILAIEYNFSNGKLLPTDSRVSPYIYLGGGINRLTDRMEMGCVVPGVYFSINMGTGFQYHLCDSISIGYQASFGMFTSDGMDFFDRGFHDMYMQNSVMVEFSF